MGDELDERTAEELRKRLDDVVGTKFDALAQKGAFRATRTRVLQCLLGTLFALLAVAAIVFVIEKHRLPPEASKPAPKPVTIRIVPTPSPP